ncbi:unnamed protein product [Mesocestoides corti]|uniref:Ras-associating domain-containing protein n=1 Tax=Mesocestoides corti TaxID=53468 RepID=A0A3P6GA15_MESCO|nr:unnamed protein product [Mesocestoides corti]
MAAKNFLPLSTRMALVEKVPSMKLERCFEDDECVRDCILSWPIHCTNLIFFEERQDVFGLFEDPQDMLEKDGSNRLPPFKDYLYILHPGNKWKRRYCVLRSSGLYASKKRGSGMGPRLLHNYRQRLAACEMNHQSSTDRMDADKARIPGGGNSATVVDEVRHPHSLVGQRGITHQRSDRRAVDRACSVSRVAHRQGGLGCSRASLGPSGGLGASVGDLGYVSGKLSVNNLEEEVMLAALRASGNFVLVVCQLRFLALKASIQATISALSSIHFGGLVESSTAQQQSRKRNKKTLHEKVRLHGDATDPRETSIDHFPCRPPRRCSSCLKSEKLALKPLQQNTSNENSRRHYHSRLIKYTNSPSYGLNFCPPSFHRLSYKNYFLILSSYNIKRNYVVKARY